MPIQRAGGRLATKASRSLRRMRVDRPRRMHGSSRDLRISSSRVRPMPRARAVFATRQRDAVMPGSVLMLLLFGHRAGASVRRGRWPEAGVRDGRRCC